MWTQFWAYKIQGINPVLTDCVRIMVVALVVIAVYGVMLNLCWRKNGH